MKTIRLLLACAALCGLATSPAFAQGTAFTYQGVLSQSGAAVNGSNDLTFTLYDAVSAGSPVGASNVVSDLLMTNGLFTVTLDFGANPFNGSDRWLQIAVRPGASTGAYTNLVPRQSITATPYAIYSGGASASGLNGTIAGSQIAPGAIGSTHLSNSVSLWNRSGNNISYNNGNVSIGTSVLHGASPGLLELESGGANNPALRLSSDGPGHGSGLWFENRNGGNAKTWAMYAGAAGGLHLGYQNTLSDVLYLGTNLNVGIGTTTPTTKLDVRGTVSFSGNVGIGTSTPQALLHVRSGNNPTLKLQSDGTSELSGRVSMRQSNESGYDLYYDGNNAVDGLILESFTSGAPTTRAMVLKINGNVGIGTTNPATKLHVDGAVTIMGSANPGAGLHVRGSGFFSDDSSALPANTGAGVRIFHDTTTGVGQVYAYNYGTASALNLILQQPGGNVGIGTTTPATKLHVAGEVTMTACNITSDRNAKEQFKPVNAREVLAKVARLPISEWQYKEHSDARHIGPMAQDFYAAFSVGRDEKHITTVDADGVALAAIQGLNEKLEERTQEVEALKKSVAALTELVNRFAAQQNGGAR